MSECLVCGAATDLYLCNGDRDELTDALTELPRWMEHLVEAATGQARLGGSAGRRGDDDPLRVNLRASELLDEVTNGLGTWVRHLCETRGMQCPAPRSVQQTCRWLAANIDAIACDPVADEIHGEITDWTPRIEKVIDRPGQQWICGPCPTVVEHGGSKRPCNLALYAADPDAVIVCPRCGTEHRARNLRQSLILRARYLPMTRPMLLRALDELGEPLPKQTFSRWTLPDQTGVVRVHPRGADPHTGEPVYWLDDVRKVNRREYDTTNRARKMTTV